MIDGRAIAHAHVVALPVLRRRVVDLEEEFQQVAIGDDLRIEDDLHRFCMRAMIAIGSVGDIAAGIANAAADDARQLADEILDAPEASPGKNGALGRHGLSPVFGLNIGGQESVCLPASAGLMARATYAPSGA